MIYLYSRRQVISLVVVVLARVVVWVVGGWSWDGIFISSHVSSEPRSLPPNTTYKMIQHTVDRYVY